MHRMLLPLLHIRCEMVHSLLQLTVLGSRGSVPVCRPDSRIFGGSTSCYMVCAGEQTVFLDAGSGLVNAPGSFPKPPLILLSHLHLDHLLGLGSYARLLQTDLETVICLPTNTVEEGRAFLNRLFGPPYWPLNLEDYAGIVRLECLQDHMQLGDLSIETMAGRHPGGCRVIRLNRGGRSIVYMTDYEHDEESLAALAVFARGADLLLYDGQFTVEEHAKKTGFGHSTAEKGLELMERTGAGRLLLIHHDPKSTDEMLLSRERAIRRVGVSFAREGEVIEL